MTQLRPLILIVVFLGTIGYICGIIVAGIVTLTSSSTKGPNEMMPAFVTQVVTAIGATLATHFGAVFGISQFTGGNPRPIPNFFQIHIWARLPPRITLESVTVEKSISRLDSVQVIAAYIYFFSLVLAAIFWGLNGFSDHSADIIKNMSVNLLGVMAGVIAVVLNVKKPT